MQWNGIRNEFDDARRGCQREDFIGTDAKVSLTSGSLGFQKIVDLIEDLLHYGVLSKVVGAAFELQFLSLLALFAVITTYQLLVPQPVCANGGDNFRHADSRGYREMRLKPCNDRNMGVVTVWT